MTSGNPQPPRTEKRDRPERARASCQRALARRAGGRSISRHCWDFETPWRPSRTRHLSHEQAAALVEAFSRFPVQETTLALVRAALETRKRFGISYWDAAVLEAARSLGCQTVLTEDLADGQDYDGVIVRNPFAAA